MRGREYAENYHNYEIIAFLLRDIYQGNYSGGTQREAFQKVKELSLIHIYGLKKGKFVHINNGVVIEDWMHPQALPEEHEQTLKQLKNDGKFVVGYFGGHALSNALEDLLSAAKAMRSNAKIHFVLVGDGAEKKNLQAFAAEQKLENVTFLPPVSNMLFPPWRKTLTAAI